MLVDKMTMNASNAYEKAFNLMKDYYMFMYEDDYAIHFKHRYTRKYIRIEKVGLQ